MKKARIISLLTAITLLLSMITCPAVSASEDVEAHVYSALQEHRALATTAQENAIKEVEAVNDTVVAKSYSEAPWSTILTGGNGLLTAEITTKQSSVRTLTLEFLRGKNITLSTPNTEIQGKIAAFKSQNDTVMNNYDLDDVSISNSAAKYGQLENELTAIFRLYNEISRDVQNSSNTLLVDGVAFTGLSNAQIEAMFSERIANFIKDINSLTFASKNTWQTAYANLLSGENKITMGLILGSDGAAALADAEAMSQLYNYVKGTDVLKTIVQYQTDLYSEDFSASNTALYSMMGDIIDDILNLSKMADVKTGLEDAGWTTAKIVNALKVSQDASDVNFYSRAINLNMILGKYLGIYKSEVKQNPVKVYVNSAATDVYDICAEKGNYKVSIINVIDTKVFTPSGNAANVISSDNDGKLKFTVTANDIGEGYRLGCYRDGSDTSKVWNFIATKALDVEAGAVPVQSIAIRQGSSIVIYIDETTQLEAIISPDGATNKNVIWSSADSSVASVSDTGKLIGKKLGYTTVTVKTEDGGFEATISVTVKKRVGGAGSMGETTIPTPTPTPTITPTPTPTQPPTGSHYFEDLEDHWASDELDELIEKGIIEGYGEEGSTGGLEGIEAIYKFYPDRPISRAEFATIICRMMSLPVTREGVIYVDTENHWSRDYVATATKYGYMIGVSETEFAPDLPIPREQVIAVILRVLTFGYDVLNPGTQKIYTSDEILELVKEHFGYEFTDLTQQVSDINSGSEWARAYVEIAYKEKIVEGYEDHTMRPTINATRAEAVIMAKRALWK